MDPNRITYFAETDARNKKIRFGIKPKDRLRHTYVIGKTGVGKSTLLENMAIQDIQNGEGMAFIDPHGGTAEKLLSYVPESRIKDVLYFAPFDMEYPVSFNVMEDIGADKRHLVVNGLMSTFEKIWVDAWSARMAYILNNTLLALLEYPGSTLLGVNRMLADKDYRKKVVDNVKDPSVKAFWVEEFGKYTERFAAEATPAIQNKVGQFTSNPLVRNLIGQSRSTFDIRKFMDEKKILIINLSKGRVGEGNANLIGSMLITKIYLAAMSRADKNDAELAQLPSFYLYVDEFQSFANKSFADILSEARKYKLSLNIAHQYIEQMEEEVRDAVFGNVGTMVTFRVGAFDAEVLEKEFAPVFTAEDLVNLGFAQVYLKLMIDGVSSAPFSARTMGPITKPDITFVEEIIESSRKQFARPRQEVEEEIQNWHMEGTVKEARPEPKDEYMARQSNGGGRPNNGGGNNTNGQYRPPVQQNGGRNDSGDRAMNGDRERNEKHPPLPVENKPDAHKIVFAKVAEELRQKEQQAVDNTAIIEQKLNTATQTITPKTQTPVSLAGLPHSQDAKKIPSKENLSSLKDALAHVVKKTEVSTAPTSAPKPNPLVEKPQEIKKEPAYPQKEQKTEHKPVDIKKDPVVTNMHEVPEDVLRDILKMDDSKVDFIRDEKQVNMSEEK
jgi:hypothetical protein